MLILLLFHFVFILLGFSSLASHVLQVVKFLPANAGDTRDKIRSLGWEDPLWQPTPIFLPGKSHGQRSLVNFSPWGCKESDTTEHTHTFPKCLSIGIMKLENSD